MTLFVKICGITDIEAAETCVEVGVDAIGFVFADSPRRVTPRQAAAISDGIPSAIQRVAVFRRPRREELHDVLSSFRPDVIQADHASMPELSGFDSLPVFREKEIARPEIGRFLYEGPVSGVGRPVDLERASSVARIGEMVLAGGLRADNVGRAIGRVRPFGVDVSSGVETGPGVKSPALIRSFVAAARGAAERLVSA